VFPTILYQNSVKATPTTYSTFASRQEQLHEKNANTAPPFHTIKHSISKLCPLNPGGEKIVFGDPSRDKTSTNEEWWTAWIWVRGKGIITLLALGILLLCLIEQSNLFGLFVHERHGTIKSHCGNTGIVCQSSLLAHNFKCQQNNRKTS